MRPKKKIVLAISVVSLLSTLSFGETLLEKGKRLYESGKYKEAASSLWDAMQEGAVEAGQYLGKMFAEGKGVAKDCKKAGLILAFCARQDPKCYLEISKLYRTGTCVPKDDKKAKFFLDVYAKKQAALRGK